MTSSDAGMIDWDLAVSIGSRLAGDGPEASRDEAAAVVAELRRRRDRSTALVRDFTGLEATTNTAPVLVVDRAGWMQANADGFATVLAPIVDQAGRRRRVRRPASAAAVGSRITGVEVGRPPRLPRREGARPVRPVLRAVRATPPGGAQHRPRRAAARGRPPRLPALGLPPRGDPPGAVHRRPVARRSPARRDAGDRGHHRGDRPASRTASVGSRRRCRGGSATAAGAAA